MYTGSIAKSVEMNRAIFETKGIPTAFHSGIKIGNSFAIATENLATGGKKVVDADGFDFNKLKNGKELLKEFVGYAKKLIELEENHIIKMNRHIKAGGSPLEASERVFFVVFDPKTRIGKIIAGDLEHMRPTENAYKKYDELLRAIDAKYPV